MSDTVQLSPSQSMESRIEAARARQAAIEAAQRQTANQPQIEHFAFLVDKLFRPTTRSDLNARLEWREQPVLVINWKASEQVLVAKPKPTGHVGWVLGTVELFEQKYAPAPDAALDLLLVALDAA